MLSESQPDDAGASVTLADVGSVAKKTFRNPAEAPGKRMREKNLILLFSCRNLKAAGTAQSFMFLSKRRETKNKA